MPVGKTERINAAFWPQIKSPPNTHEAHLAGWPYEIKGFPPVNQSVSCPLGHQTTL